MTESNETADKMKVFAQMALERGKTEIEASCIFIVVHDDEQQIEMYKNIATKNEDSAERIFVYNNVDECYDFVIDIVSTRQSVQITVFVGGQLVSDVVSSIHDCEEVKAILILNKPPYSDEERKAMQLYPKVKYMADHVSSKMECDLIEQSDIEATQQIRFNESISFGFESSEDSLSDTEPIERSYKQLDGNFLLRFLMIICLRNARLFSSNKTDLIKLFETQYHIDSQNINRFQETYESNKAVLFYTKNEFIYGKLNNALRTSSINDLLSFQFIYQDI
ncbi:hypothetical protein I4U23_022427 [Adineta vaga]|nr:hypothetical protein I4U23_022427 [Adineta vaga]